MEVNSGPPCILSTLTKEKFILFRGMYIFHGQVPGEILSYKSFMRQILSELGGK